MIEMVSKEMREEGSLIRDLDARDYRKIAGALASKQLATGILIEIERKKVEGVAVIGLWSRDTEGAKEIIDEVLSKFGIPKTLVIAPKEEKKPAEGP